MRLSCGEYSCSREAKQVPVGLVIGEYPEYDEKDREEARCYQAAKAIKCNVHVGALKRQKWGTPPTFEPLENRADVRLLAEGHWTRIESERKAMANAKADADRKKAEERFASEWAGWGTDECAVRNLDKDDYRRNAGVINVRVANTSADSWNSWDVTTEQSTRYDDLPLPVYLRVNRSGSLTPNEARALSKALLLMADRVDAANALIQQNFEVK